MVLNKKEKSVQRPQKSSQPRVYQRLQRLKSSLRPNLIPELENCPRELLHQGLDALDPLLREVLLVGAQVVLGVILAEVSSWLFAFLQLLKLSARLWRPLVSEIVNVNSYL